MNVYISHSGAYDYENELYKPVRESELSQVYHFFLPHEPENIDVDAKDELKRTDMLVAEASLSSTGQGIELAQAQAARACRSFAFTKRAPGHQARCVL